MGVFVDGTLFRLEEKFNLALFLAPLHFFRKRVIKHAQFWKSVVSVVWGRLTHGIPASSCSFQKEGEAGFRVEPEHDVDMEDSKL